jgi:hypothetical protein
MRSVLVTLLLALPLTAAADRTYVDKSGTHDCTKDPNAMINTSAGAFTFTGPCEKIAVNGSGNKITIESVKKLAINGAKNAVDVDAADKIAVNGTENTVNYKRGVTEKTPKVAALGANNKLNQVK